MSETESSEYFNTRPIDSQVSAMISEQSKPIQSREYLMQLRAKIIQDNLDGVHLQKPKRWGGFLLIPDRFEFYQGQSNRLSDRIEFRRLTADDDNNNKIDDRVTHRGINGWIYERLSP